MRLAQYDYDLVLEKHFAHARMYDLAQGRMLGADPVRRGLNGCAYCDNDPVNQTDPIGEIANVVIGGIAGGIIGGAFDFAGSALSQIAGGNGFSARKAWGAAANGPIVGAARGALVGSGAGIPLAFGVDFAAGMAGSLADQKIASGRIAPVRAVVDGVFNVAGGRLYETSPLKNARNAFIRGALEGAVKGGAYNIADVLDNMLSNPHRSRRVRNPKNPRTQDSRSRKGLNPNRSRHPQMDCVKPKPLKGMTYPDRRRSGGRNILHRNDGFRLGSFVRDVVSGAVMGGLSSVAFYGAGKAVEALKERRMKDVKLNKVKRGPLYDLGNTLYTSEIGDGALNSKDVSKEWVIENLSGKTRQSTRIAELIKQKEVKLNILGDELYEQIVPKDSVNSVAFYENGGIYIRKNSPTLLSDIVHEGTHAWDVINKYGYNTKKLRWSWEKRAYYYERQFQISLGVDLEFKTINEMLFHIYSNYKRETYYPY